VVKGPLGIARGAKCGRVDVGSEPWIAKASASLVEETYDADTQIEKEIERPTLRRRRSQVGRERHEAPEAWNAEEREVGTRGSRHQQEAGDRDRTVGSAQEGREGSEPKLVVAVFTRRVAPQHVVAVVAPLDVEQRDAGVPLVEAGGTLFRF
jgi:hypothetical protein